jgi:hypothetical protein
MPQIGKTRRIEIRSLRQRPAHLRLGLAKLTCVPSPTQRGIVMPGAVTHSLVHQFAAMKPTEFGATIEPKWQVADKLVKEVRTAVEKQQLTPLDGARVISSIAATLFGYDEFILREISPETLLASPSRR